MRISDEAIYALAASITLTALVGCGGSTPIAPAPLVESSAASPLTRWQIVRKGRIKNHPLTTRSFFTPDAKGKPLIFLSDVTNGAVDIYLQANKDQKMAGQITGLGPSGLASDTGGNLYVGNYVSGVSNILVYAPPYTGPPQAALDDSGSYDDGVAVSAAGVVAAANQCDAPNCSSTGNVTLYAKNSSMPCATVADPTNFPHPVWDAFDRNGNLYVEGFTSGGNTVIGEVKGGCKAKKLGLLTVGTAPSFVSGIQVDKAHRIALLTTGSSTYDVLNLYKAPKHGSLGNPVLSTQLMIPPSVDGPIAFALSATNAHVYTVDAGSVFLMDKYAFPRGGTSEKTIVGGWAAVAVTPPAVP